MARFDPEIDDDNPPLDMAVTAGMTLSRRGRPKSVSPKVEVKIRLDAATVEHLRDSGPGWQTRVNAVLGRPVAAGQIWHSPEVEDETAGSEGPVCYASAVRSSSDGT